MTRANALVHARDAALAFPVRRPVVTLALAALLTALAVFGITRLRPDTSLESMFAKDDPAADALVRVLNTFSAVEELLVLVAVPDGPDAPKGPQPESLAAFAERFELALRASRGTSSPQLPLAEQVIYRVDPDARAFFQDVLVPAGIFYLNDEAFARARQRLTPEGMRAQLRRNESLLSQPGPAAGAAAELLVHDPLRLNEFIKARFASLGGGSHRAMAVNGNGKAGAAQLSPDGRALLIRVVGRRPPSDLDFSKELVAAARAAVTSANTGNLDVSLGGAYAIATTSERAIRADATRSSAGALACITVLFVLAYRRPVRLLLLAVGPLALGSLLGFGAHVLFEPTITILSAAVGAMMLGMGIDHSVHYLTHYETRRATGLGPAHAAGETSRHLVPAMFAAWLTSVIGFVAIGRSNVRALGDFALLGSLGLAGVFLTSITVLPALLVLTDRRRGPAGAAGHGDVSGRASLRFSIRPLLDRIARHRRAAITCSLAVFVAALVIVLLRPGKILPLESDLTVMHPRPNPALETYGAITRRFGSTPGSLVVHLRAASPEQLVALAHQVDERFRAPTLRHAGVAGTMGLGTFLPDPRTVGRLAALPEGEADRVVKDFRSAVTDSAFEVAAFEKYEGFLRTMLSRREPPALADLVRYPGLARAVLPSAAFAGDRAALPTEAITHVLLDRAVDQRDARAAVVLAGRAALDGLPGATLTGLPVLGHDAERHVRAEIPRVFAVSLGLVLLYVLVHFRSARDALLSMSMVAYSLVVLLAVTRLAGVRLNMINLTALPLLIGMTLDYGIFLVSLARDAKRRGASRKALIGDVATSAQAVLVCAASTVLGFGSLAFNSVPAVQSLGIVVAVGMIASLGGTLFLLAPLLLRTGRDEEGMNAPTAKAVPAVTNLR